MTDRDNFNFYALVVRRFPADLDSVCLETADGLIYSWRDLHHASGRLANWLAALRLPAGARVAVQDRIVIPWSLVAKATSGMKTDLVSELLHRCGTDLSKRARIEILAYLREN